MSDILLELRNFQANNEINPIFQYCGCTFFDFRYTYNLSLRDLIHKIVEMFSLNEKYIPRCNIVIMLCVICMCV